MLRFIVTLFIFSSTLFQGQTSHHTMINIGYTYQNQSFAEVGGKILLLKKDHILYRFGGAALLGSTDHHFAIMPKIQADVLYSFKENTGLSQGYYYILGVESTNKYFSPHLGLNILGVLDFTTGYTIAYPQKNLFNKTLEGIHFGIILNIPLSIFH